MIKMIRGKVIQKAHFQRFHLPEVGHGAYLLFSCSVRPPVLFALETSFPGMGLGDESFPKAASLLVHMERKGMLWAILVGRGAVAPMRVTATKVAARGAESLVMERISTGGDVAVSTVAVALR